jgi:hypothetical protein
MRSQPPTINHQPPIGRPPKNPTIHQSINPLRNAVFIIGSQELSDEITVHYAPLD